MAELNPPGFLQQEAHPPDVLRRITKSLTNDNPGVATSADLIVTTTGAGPLGVSVAAGSALIPGTSRPDAQGYYHVTNDDPKVIALTAAHATLYRRDLIFARVRDDEEDGGGVNAWDLGVATGTPGTVGGAATPVAPANSIALASVLVAPTSTVVVAGNITDMRTLAGGSAAPRGYITHGAWAGDVTYTGPVTEQLLFGVTFTAEASRRYKLSAVLNPYVVTPGTNAQMSIRKGTTSHRALAFIDQTGASWRSVPLMGIDVPGAGLVTYNVYVAQIQAGGSLRMYQGLGPTAANLLVEDIGAA